MKKVLILLMLAVSLSVYASGYNQGIYTGSSEMDKEGNKLFATLVVGEDEKIEYLLIDEIIAVDKKDFTKGFTTKRIQGEKYGMKKFSGIKKEWNTQVDSISKMIVDNQGITFKVKEDGKTDGIAGASIRVNNFVSLVKPLLEKAKK